MLMKSGGLAAVLLAATVGAVPLAHAQGDAALGKALYASRCVACHSPNYNGVGPAHAGVLGRKAGSVPGYTYSSALKAADVVWTAQTLNQWLLNPEALVPGQKMGVSVPDATERQHLIAYLQTLVAR